jgi:O-antigen biosynthesis protein
MDSGTAADERLEATGEARTAPQEMLLDLAHKIRDQQEQIQAHESSIARLEDELAYIVEGRLWKTLKFGADLVKKIAPSKSNTPWAPGDKEYQRWIRQFELPGRQAIRAALPKIRSNPLISIVMPVYNTDLPALRAAIRSVVGQSYPKWELCIADDNSSRGQVRHLLERFSASDSRIRTVFRERQGGISAATNSALEMATGDFLGFLDHDDLLAEDALAAICEALDRDQDCELLYSDEDKIDDRGRRYHPVFKCNWSPELLRSSNYICHFLVLRRDLQKRIGEFQSSYDGSQDYDYLLRAAEVKPRAVHIPKVLYHWRAVQGSTATSPHSKNYAIEAARRALADHCRRTDSNTKVESTKTRGWWRVRYQGSESTKVSIIVAASAFDTLKCCLESIVAKSTHGDYQVLVVNRTNSIDISLLVSEELVKDGHPVREIADCRAESYASAMNRAALVADGAALLFVEDEITVEAADWIEAMLEQAGRQEIGAVGAKIVFRNKRIAEAGLILGVRGICAPAFGGLKTNVPHYFGLSNAVRNVSAVSSACLMTRTDVFWRGGGFDGDAFGSELAAVDFCLRLEQLGYRNVCTPFALLNSSHATPKRKFPEPEISRMRERWADVIEDDPYYNSNLTRKKTDYSLRTKV